MLLQGAPVAIWTELAASVWPRACEEDHFSTAKLAAELQLRKGIVRLETIPNRSGQCAPQGGILLEPEAINVGDVQEI
jgi:hypothetical protein